MLLETARLVFHCAGERPNMSDALACIAKTRPSSSAAPAHPLALQVAPQSLKRRIGECDDNDISLILQSLGLHAPRAPLLGVFAAVPSIAIVSKLVGLGAGLGFVVPLLGVGAYALYMSRRSLLSRLSENGLDPELSERLLQAITPQRLRSAKQIAGWSTRADLWPREKDQAALANALATLLRETDEFAVNVEETRRSGPA